MMKMLLKKELREHRWMFAAALAVMTLGYLRSMYALLPAQAWLHITRRSFLMVTSIGGGGFMLALGFRQMFEEKRRGSWTFLLHRPIAGRRIFAAKVMAALLMFAGAVVLPTALVAAWCAWPGNIAGPFVPSMLAPAGVDLLCALPYYFTGCVIGLWQARFTASRGLLLVVPLANSLFAHGAAEVWMPLVSGVVATGWMAWLAGAAFIGFERRKRSGWAMLAAALWAGLCAIHLVGAAFMPEPMTTSHQRSEQDRPAEERWFVSKKGAMHRAIIRRGSVEAVFAEDGQPLEGDYGGMGAWLREIEADAVQLSASTPDPFNGRSYEGYRDMRRFERIARTEGGYAREWYYDYLDRRFIAFDRRSGAGVGSLGPDGFSAQGDGRGFGGKPLVRLGVDEPVLFFADGVFRVDWRASSIVRVKMKGEGRWLRASQLGRSTRRLLRSATHVAVIEGTRPTAMIVLDTALTSDSLAVGYVEATEEYFVRYPLPEGAGDAQPNGGEVVVFHDKDGAEVRRWQSPTNVMAGSRPMMAFMPASTFRQAIVLPPMVNGYEMVNPKKYAWERVQWRSIHVLIALMIGVISALLSLLLSRGHRASLRWTIAGLCLFGGPIGVVLPLLFPQERGAACSACGVKREVNDQPCDGCGAQLRGYAAADSDIIDDAYMPVLGG